MPLTTGPDRVLPLTVLVHEGPMARAYLAYLRAAGYRPERIIQMVLSRDPSSKKPIMPWLPAAWRGRLAERIQVARMGFWPRRIHERYPTLYAGITETLHRELGIPHEVFLAIVSESGYGDFSPRVEKVLVENLADPRLAKILSDGDSTAVIYTGGGLIPQRLLDIQGLRFIHIHPGFLPYVRGADGLLWSICVRGRPGVSAFYMAPGIDTGAVILARELPPLAFPLAASDRPDDMILYRAVFSFCDPALRAHLLVDIVRADCAPLALPACSQNLSLGVTYHFMHPTLRALALTHLFPAH